MLHAIHISDCQDPGESIVLVNAETMQTALETAAERIITASREHDSEGRTWKYETHRNGWVGFPHPTLTVTVTNPDGDAWDMVTLTACGNYRDLTEIEVW